MLPPISNIKICCSLNAHKGDKRILSTSISLGNCVDFGVMGGSDVLFSLALTIINAGSVGNAPGTGILLCCNLNSVYLRYSH
jgi:hypothetical protein